MGSGVSAWVESLGLCFAWALFGGITRPGFRPRGLRKSLAKALELQRVTLKTCCGPKFYKIVGDDPWIRG